MSKRKVRLIVMCPWPSRTWLFFNGHRGMKCGRLHSPYPYAGKDLSENMTHLRSNTTCLNCLKRRPKEKTR